MATGLIFTARTLDLNRSGQVTERFTRAVEQLGQREPGKLDVRLGGIYALERIARDSAADLPTVVEVLCAHLREYNPWPPRLPGQGRANLTPDQVDKLADLQTRAPDLQAVLTVLGRLPNAHPSRSGRVPTAANAVRVVLIGMDLRRANLGGADLEGADLRSVHLEGANLRGARLEGALLVNAHLERANLDEAHLERANLLRAHLEGASLLFARLEGALLVNAHLERAKLHYAHLEGANLGGADLEGAYLDGADLQGADLRRAHLERANLGGADLEGAMANAATGWPSDFDWRAVGVREEKDEERR